MLPQKLYTRLKNDLNTGVYKTLRLVKKVPDKPDEVLAGFNRTSDLEAALVRLEHFKRLLNGEIGEGLYEIHAKSTISGLIEKFPVQVHGKNKNPELEHRSGLETIISSSEQFEDSEFMDIEEFKRMLRQNADLEAKVAVLTIERDWYKKMSDGRESQALSDKSEGWKDKLADLGKDAVPGFINLMDNLITMRKEQYQAKQTERDGKVQLKNKPVTKIDPDKRTKDLTEEELATQRANPKWNGWIWAFCAVGECVYCDAARGGGR